MGERDAPAHPMMPSRARMGAVLPVEGPRSPTDLAHTRTARKFLLWTTTPHTASYQYILYRINIEMAHRHDISQKSLRINETLPEHAPAQSLGMGAYAQAKRGASSDPCNDLPTCHDHKLVLGRPASYWLVGG